MLRTRFLTYKTFQSALEDFQKGRVGFVGDQGGGSEHFKKSFSLQCWAHSTKINIKYKVHVFCSHLKIIQVNKGLKLHTHIEVSI